MNRKNDLLIKPTSFAELCGCTELGDFDPTTNTYTWQVATFNLRAVNALGTVHGGAIAALFDEACCMVIFHCYGLKSAVTKSMSIEFFRGLRPKSPWVITCKIIKTTGEKKSDRIFIVAEAKANDKLIARMKAVWTRRF